MLVESNEDKLLGALEGLIPYIDMNPLVVNINRDEEVKRLLSENHSDDYVVLSRAIFRYFVSLFFIEISDSFNTTLSRDGLPSVP